MYYVLYMVNKRGFENNVILWVLGIILIIVLITALVFYTFFSEKQDPLNLEPPSDTGITGKAFYQNSPLTKEQLEKGVKFDRGWNTFSWAAEGGSIPVQEAVASLLPDNIVYIYSQSERKYYFNPDGRYGHLRNHPYYKKYLLDPEVLKPKQRYYAYMKSKGILKYSFGPTPVTITLSDGTKIIPGMVNGNSLGDPEYQVLEHVCVDKEGVVLQSRCYDTDAYKGNDSIYEKGAIYGNFYMSRYDVDYCKDANTLFENVCEMGDKGYEMGVYSSGPRTLEVDCPNGCKDGACVATTNGSATNGTSCKDSDGGKIYNITGSVSGTNSSGSTYNLTDRCDHNNLTLREWYCEGNNSKSVSHNCTSGICRFKGYYPTGYCV